MSEHLVTENLLGTYLRDRRTKLDPAALGFPSERRRTLGLRREEVAQRANISPTWYTWLEQGRGGAPSAEVLDRIAHALILTDVEREHLFLLGLARISHTVFARSERVARRHGQIPRTCRPVASDDAGGDWDFAGLRGAARTGLGGPRDGVAVGSRRGRACQAGEPRALAATRRTAAQPQTSAAGQLDAIAILMRRTLIRTSAPILSSLRRMVPQLALANGV